MKLRVLCACACLLACSLLARASTISAISSNFNGTQIGAGDIIWFTGVLKLTGSVPMTSPIDIFITGASIGSSDFNITVPDAEVSFSPGAGTASTSYTASGWDTVSKFGASGNTFMEAVAYQVPAGGLPGGINPVTWTAAFSTGTPGVTLNWQWAAAVYTSFSADYNALNVQPTDDHSASPYGSSDHAGTPENYEAYVVGGARGGGGSNYTGSLSPTASVTPSVSSVPEPGYFLPVTMLLLALGFNRRSRSL
jgi:hypothetical protein